ncbi:MAG: hypothetical protein IPG58_03920 [Acidobacteria bacterium]|nr:hypothetical protein [Acidobacteriota bacterium]
MANPENYKAPADINRLRGIALGIGGIALIIWAVGHILIQSRHFARGFWASFSGAVSLSEVSVS